MRFQTRKDGTGNEIAIHHHSNNVQHFNRTVDERVSYVVVSLSLPESVRHDERKMNSLKIGNLFSRVLVNLSKKIIYLKIEKISIYTHLPK